MSGGGGDDDGDGDDGEPPHAPHARDAPDRITAVRRVGEPGDGARYVLVYLGAELPTHAAFWHGPPFQPGTRFPLVPGRRTFIGRGANADIRCFSNAVARIHVIAQLEGDVLHIEDAQSTNGTWKDGVSITTGTMRVGERIALAGAFLFELQRD